MVDDHATGPVAVITGASSGIGAATARALAAQGYQLALLARRVDRLQQLATQLGNGAVAVAADVTDRDALAAAADRVQRELGGADVLVNNAGVMLLGPFGTEQREEARRMVEVNPSCGNQPAHIIDRASHLTRSPRPKTPGNNGPVATHPAKRPAHPCPLDNKPLHISR